MLLSGFMAEFCGAACAALREAALKITFFFSG